MSVSKRAFEVEEVVADHKRVLKQHEFACPAPRESVSSSGAKALAIAELRPYRQVVANEAPPHRRLQWMSDS